MITLVGSLKGGTGKSTVVFNLAVWLSKTDTPVTVIDLDPQATLLDVGQVRLEENWKPPIEVHDIQHLNDSLRDVEGEVLIDVGTADMDAMKKAVLLADRIVVPVPPSQADVWSTQTFIDMVQQISEPGNAPEIICFINRADTHPAVFETVETAAALVALPHVKYLKRRLCQRLPYRRSFSEGLAVFELEPRGKAAGELTGLAASLFPGALT